MSRMPDYSEAPRKIQSSPNPTPPPAPAPSGNNFSTPSTSNGAAIGPNQCRHELDMASDDTPRRSIWPTCRLFGHAGGRRNYLGRICEQTGHSTIASRPCGLDLAVKAFEHSQSLSERLVTADYHAKRTILSIVLETVRLNSQNMSFPFKNPSICYGAKNSSRSLEPAGHQ